MNRQKWEIPFSEPDISEELLSAGYNPLLASVLTLKNLRSVKDAENLLGDKQELGDPLQMTDMIKARDRLLSAIEKKETVAVYGDYDVDGITASCLLSSYLKSKGLQCIMHIPDREGEGYGLNTDALDSFKSKGVSLVVTVDCGITAVDEAEHAKNIGIDLVITDHHECPSGALPDAVAVVDYKRPDDDYPYKILAGVGVAFKLVCACEGTADRILEEYSDLVAIGTVADVMPLINENRYLVKHGLNRIRTSPRIGITTMMSSFPMSIKDFSENSISFSLAPRLNAAGRMGQASTAAKLISASDASTAQKLADELNSLNDERKKQERIIWDDACRMLDGQAPDSPLVLSSSEWHPGVIGIVASRLSEKYKLPAIIICLKKDTDVAKGSCRSYGDFNLHEALSKCRDYLKSFGGHALAAGLSIEKGKIDDFRNALKNYYNEITPSAPPGVKCDLLILDPSILSVENVKSLSLLSPFGTDNEKPRFCMYGVRADSISRVGADGKHLKFRISLEGKSFDCIYFSPEQELLGKITSLKPGESVDIVFNPQINEFRNNITVQLAVQDMRPHDSYELCDKILCDFDSCTWTASRYCPDRTEFIKAWKHISTKGYKVGSNVDEILSRIPDDQLPETFCICLRAFLESGLLRSGTEGSVFGAYAPAPDTKVDLESTSIIRSLKI